ncbi:MAG: TonB-dependent receptor [Nevskiaceae bacterium]|jgi:iron complex outermembrane receptor protein|nr:TonB-dependent receptor [Nevskiaceae bacterium]
MTRIYRRSSVTLAVAAALSAAIPATVLAQQADDDLLSEIVVTGTRAQQRSRLDTMAPVDVVSVGQLTSQGTTELAQALSTAAPSLNFPRPSITDGTDMVRPVTLRGLAPDQTLVLVNSKRRHQSALVNVNGSIGRGSSGADLNAIPMAAIDRVEVLRDGASAQYGSDAIAGVVNLHLREASSGGAAQLTWGQYNTRVRAARSSRTEHDGDTLTVSVWGGLPLGNDGFVTLTGEYRDRDPTSRGDLDPRLAVAPLFDPPRVTSRYGDPKIEDLTFYANAGLPLNDVWDMYGWAGFQQRDGEAAAFPRLRNNVNVDLSVYPDGFLPLIATDIKDITAGFGVRGEIGEWRADFSVVYGNNDLGYRTENSINGTLIPNSPTSFDSGGMDYDQLVFNADFARALSWFGEADTNLALGLEARRETYGITAGEEASWINAPGGPPGAAPGAQGFPGFQPSNVVNESRNNIALYVDIESQITEQFRASLAARAEDYSDFGSQVTGKVSARYDFAPSFALRGTVSTGFRAPGLQQSWFTSTATNFIGGIPLEVGTFPPTSAVAQALGAQSLEPEESVNYSVGAVFHVSGFEATVDVYRIDIDDRIVLSENLGGTPAIDALLGAFPGVGRVRFFINGVNTETTGVDAVLRYALLTENAGKWDFTLSANWNDTNVTKLPSTNVVPQGGELFGRINVLTFEQGQPDNKQSLSVDWNLPVGFGTIGATAKLTNYGGVIEPQAPPITTDVFLGSAMLADLELRAGLSNGLTLSLGADNVFDKYPTMTPESVNTTGATSFSRYSPFGFGGRFWYARLGFNW